MELASIETQLERVENDVLYYKNVVTVGKKSHVLIIPRYDPFMGWIELFGLPPQHEWVVLKAPKDFKKDATLQFGDKTIKERIVFATDPSSKSHTITLTRKADNSTELFEWVEDYSDAPLNIIDTGTFSFDNGSYTYRVVKKLISLSDGRQLLTPEQKAFTDLMIKEHGMADQCWLKEFTAEGSMPPVFSSLFCTSEIADTSNAQGFVLEMGYLTKEGDVIDAMHGDWYKLLSVNNTLFTVSEGGFTSTSVMFDGKRQKVKNTYHKHLHSYAM